MKNVNKKDETFRTSDFALITTLSLFFPIDGTDRSEPKRVVFIFKKTKQLEETIEKYYQLKLRIEPRQFFNQTKTVKSILYEGETNF